MITIGTASSDAHFEAILRLQRRYHERTLSADEQAAEGFVFAEHTVPVLKRMAALSPQAIALLDDDVVGYCLSLPLALQAVVPALAPMFEQFARCDYRGRPLSSYRFFVGGQICVDRARRGQGLVGRLYDHLRDALVDSNDLCVTEIAVRNRVSLRAHEKIGFEVVSTYTAGDEAWAIVARDLNERTRGL